MVTLYYVLAAYAVVGLLSYWLTQHNPELGHDQTAPLSERWLFWGFCVFWPIGWGLLIYFVVVARQSGGYPYD